MLGGIASAQRVRVQLVVVHNLISGKGKHSQYKLKSDTFLTTVKEAAVNHQTDSELELDN